jgi:Ala-tRNA(Pro) deacylase
MNVEIRKGRPFDESKRLQKEIRVYDLLDQLEIDYERVDHEELHTMEACIEINEVLNHTVCKNLFLCNNQKTIFFLLMMPGNKKFKTRELSRQINTARLSFAPEEYLEQFLDITPGSVSVLGLMNDKNKRVQLLIEEDIILGNYFSGHPCINTSTLRFQVEELIHKFLPAIDHDYICVHLTGEE